MHFAHGVLMARRRHTSYSQTFRVHKGFSSVASQRAARVDMRHMLGALHVHAHCVVPTVLSY